MHVRRISQSSLPDFAQCMTAAMAADEVLTFAQPYNHLYPDSLYSSMLLRIRLRWYRGEEMFLCYSDPTDSFWDGHEHIMGAASYSNTIDGLAKPVRRGWLGNWFERSAIDAETWYEKTFRMHKGKDYEASEYVWGIPPTEACKPYLDQLPETYKAKKGTQHFELELLGVHPDFWRRGVGGKLLEYGKERATEKGVPLVLVATLMGEKLYRRLGFDVVGKAIIVGDAEVRAKGEGKNKIVSERLKKRLEEADFGLGKGKGVVWAAMAWEPEGMRD